MALGRETPLALWNDISRCPIAVGDLTFAVNRVHIVLKAVPPSCDHPTKWWQVINDKEVISGIGAVPWVIRPFQNVTVRKRLERAVRTVQYRWRARRIARVLSVAGLPPRQRPLRHGRRVRCGCTVPWGILSA